MGRREQIGAIHSDDQSISMEIEMDEMEQSSYDEPRSKKVKIGSLCGVSALTLGREERVYGGPEEGGWYYDVFTPIRVFIVPSRRLNRLSQLLVRLVRKANRGQPGLSSVLSTGLYAIQNGVQTQPDPRQFYS